MPEPLIYIKEANVFPLSLFFIGHSYQLFETSDHLRPSRPPYAVQIVRMLPRSGIQDLIRYPRYDDPIQNIVTVSLFWKI